MFRPAKFSGTAHSFVLPCALAHHVMAHQFGHQSLGLIGTKNVDLLLRNENIISFAKQIAAELRDMSDRRLASQPGERRIGIGPKFDYVDADSGSSAQDPAFIVSCREVESVRIGRLSLKNRTTQRLSDLLQFSR
jgi:hypothetical protein